MSFADRSLVVSGSRPSWPRQAIIAGAGLLIAALLWSIRNNFPFDDTFITFRYVANLAHGHGLVWNVGGPHTEGYTNFLYILLLAPFSAMGADLVTTSQVLNVIAVILTAMAVYRITHTLAGPALIFLLPYTWANAFSGMETSLFAMWIVLAVAAKQARWQFIFSTLAMLTRPEAAMLGAIMLLTNDKLRTKTGRNVLRHLAYVIREFAIYFALPLAIYALWKLWYFGDLLPNSFYVKVAQTSQHFAGRGAVTGYLISRWYLLLPAAFGLWRVWRRWRSAAMQRPLLLALWSLALLAFYSTAWLLMNFYSRFFNSVDVALCALAAIGLSHLADLVIRRKSVDATEWTNVQRMRLAALLVVAVLPVYLLWSHSSVASYMLSGPSGENEYAPLARTLNSIPDHEQITLCWSDAGYLPYYTGMQHIDPVGLNTTAIAHATSWQQVDRIIAHAKPDMIFVPYYSNTNEAFHDAHGLIGKGYATLMQEPELTSYKQIGLYRYPIYDIRIYADTQSAHFADMSRAFQH